MSSSSIVDQWVNEHFSHVTPGTPDHHILSRAIEALKAVLEPKTKPLTETTKQNTKGE